MTVAEDTTQQPGNEQPADKSAQQPAADKVAQAQQPADKGAQPAAGAKPALEQKPEPKRVRLKGNEEDIPEDADIIEMTPRAFASRVGRMTAKELKKLFGTDDIEQIKKDQQEAAQLKADKEVARQAQLTKEQKLEEEKSKERNRAEAAERQLKEERESRNYERQDRSMQKLAAQFLDEDHIDVELTRFAKHLTSSFRAKELDRMTDKQFATEAKSFFEERVKAKPKIGKDYDAQRREEIKAELQGRKPRVLVGNGAGDAGVKPTGQEKNGGQLVVPGKLPPGEYRKWKKAQGFTY